MNGNDARSKMAEFWSGQSHNALVEEVMLDDDAEALSKLEIPEIMSYLPPLEGKVVLELGAGIRGCKNMDADMDVLYIFNGDPYLPSRYNLIFTNWLLMYLDEQESVQLLSRALSWLKDGGHLFVRESCYKPGGNKKIDGEMFSNIEIETSDSPYGFRVVSSKPVFTYIKVKYNANQITWLLQKVLKSKGKS